MYLPVTCSGRFICLWHLKPSTSKTVTSVFHLHNNRSHRELNVHMNGQCLKHKPYSVCLGVTLDRTLSCRGHLSHSAVKLKSWNNLIATLHTSALAICYSIAEYCCLVWARSSYTNLVVSQLNSSMRLISGCLQPTQHSWLPLVSNIVTLCLLLYIAKRQLTVCFKSSKPIQIGLCMLIFLSIHLYSLHLDTQYGQT